MQYVLVVLTVNNSFGYDQNILKNILAFGTYLLVVSSPCSTRSGL